MPKPCKNCPFRKTTLQNWLHKETVKDIVETDSFVCHETIDNDRKQCAGHMLLMGNNNVFIRLLRAMQMTDTIDNLMQHRHLIFDSIQDFAEHHSNDKTNEFTEWNLNNNVIITLLDSNAKTIFDEWLDRYKTYSDSKILHETIDKTKERHTSTYALDRTVTLQMHEVVSFGAFINRVHNVELDTIISMDVKIQTS